MNGTRWLERYMLVPYRKGGRAFDGCDCWGLYELILSNELERAKVPSFDAVTIANPNAVRRAIRGALAAGLFRKIAGEPAQVAQRFDAILMKGYVGGRRVDLHLGCALGDGLVVHMDDDGCGPRVLRLDDADMTWRICDPVHGAYRPAFLEQAA